MGIKSTQDITRADAIERIRRVDSCILNQDYKELESISFDPDYDIAKFIDHSPKRTIHAIEKWTNTMIEDLLDEPFYRKSVFDNYIIR